MIIEHVQQMPTMLCQSEKYYLLSYTDINECAERNACDDNAGCVDSVGSYWCQCLPGFQGDGYNCTGQSFKLFGFQLTNLSLITDIDECQNVTCGQNAKCSNTVGNYKCQCDSGFTGDGYNCSSMLWCTDVAAVV